MSAMQESGQGHPGLPDGQKDASLGGHNHGHHHHDHNGKSDVEHSPARSNKEGGYQGGSNMSQTITPGGHTINDDLLAVAMGPRKIGNPLPMGAMAFATTTIILSLYNAGVRGLATPNAVVCYTIWYGGMTQYLAGIWEFASGNTFGATLFCTFGCFWWGFSMIFIPFFGEMGTYNGVAGVYSEEGLAASEATSAIGLFLWIYFGITTVFLIGAVRSSIALILVLFFLDLTFALLAAYYYSGVAAVGTAGGGVGVITALLAFYLAAGAFWTKHTSYFSLPLGDISIKD